MCLCVLLHPRFRVFVTDAIPFCAFVQCLLLPPIYHNAELVMCIRDRRITILCLSTVYRWFCIFETCAITFCVFVQCILLPPIYHDAGLVMCFRDRRNSTLCLGTLCSAEFLYSRQVQYCSVSLYIDSVYYDTRLVMCIRDRCNTIVCFL